MLQLSLAGRRGRRLISWLRPRTKLYPGAQISITPITVSVAVVAFGTYGVCEGSAD